MHTMTRTETNLFMMALCAATVTDSLRLNSKVRKNPRPPGRMWHRGWLCVKRTQFHPSTPSTPSTSSPGLCPGQAGQAGSGQGAQVRRDGERRQKAHMKSEVKKNLSIPVESSF